MTQKETEAKGSIFDRSLLFADAVHEVTTMRSVFNSGRHNKQGIQSPTRGHVIERIDDGFRVPEQQGSLAEVIQQ